VIFWINNKPRFNSNGYCELAEYLFGPQFSTVESFEFTILRAFYDSKIGRPYIEDWEAFNSENGPAHWDPTPLEMAYTNFHEAYHEVKQLTTDWAEIEVRAHYSAVNEWELFTAGLLKQHTQLLHAELCSALVPVG
jgi:hypothetical protein